MKTTKIVFLEDTFNELKQALKWDDGKEKSAFLLAHSSEWEGSLKLLPSRIIKPQSEDYESRSGGYYKVTKAFVNKVFNEAIEKQMHVVQCHIHPHDPARYSGVDEVQEPKLMRHVAEGIDGIYHASMVFGNSQDTIDSWIYDKEADIVTPVQKITVIGTKGFDIYVPPRSPLAQTRLSGALDRTVRAFGKHAMQKIGLLDVAVAGASALGGPLLEMLARDKINSLMICDLDCIEESNLNRLPGTTMEDIGKPKAQFYADLVTRISPKTAVSAITDSVYEKETQAIFAQADIIFGCLDSGARLSLNRLANANLMPYFDMGASIYIEDNNLSFVGGQVYSIIPGSNICLFCSGSFDHLLSEYLSPEDREREISQGYIKGDDGVPDPSVMYLDSVIAGVGYSQFNKYVTGRGAVFKVHYDETLNKLMASGCMETKCMTCQSEGFLGKGDLVDPMIPQTSMPAIGQNAQAEASTNCPKPQCLINASPKINDVEGRRP